MTVASAILQQDLIQRTRTGRDIPHGGLADLTNDTHPQYLLLAGRTDQTVTTPIVMGDVTDNTTVEENGFVKFSGGARYWKDVDFPIIIRVTGVGIPTLEVINGNLTAPQWQVNDFNMSESQELVHGWEEGTQVFWHIHLTTNGLDITDRYVRFEVEYGYATPNGAWVFPSTIDSGDILIPANTADKTMKILSLGNFTPTGVQIGGHVLARLKRIASTGTAPSNNPWIPMLQLHIHCDSEGSRNISSK